MTETSAFPFDPPPGGDVEVTPPDRRKLYAILAAAVVAAALLGYFVVLPMLGGVGSAPTASVVRHSLPGASAAPRASAATPVPARKTFDGVVGKDPFHELVTAPVAATSPAAGAGASSSPGASPAASPAPGTVVPSTIPVPGKTIFTVFTVAGSTANVTVNGKKFSPTVGQIFNKSFKLLKTTGGNCANFAYGEMRFELCEGQSFGF